MSNLLQSVLNARLANVALTSEHNNESLQEWEQVDSDEELVHVQSIPVTTPSTPLNLSRPSSPGPLASAPTSPRKKSKAQPSTDDENSASKLRKKKYSKLDPLRAFNNEIAQHIFLQLPQNTLAACTLVCKHWKKSATVNYCWYRLYQHHFSALSLDEPLPPLPSWGSGGAKWTRRESKTEWKTQFAKQKRIQAREAERADSLPGSGTATPTRTQRMTDAGIPTAQASRMEQWKTEDQERWSKAEMREYYKAGNKGGKVKGKTGKGGVKTGTLNDGGLWQ